MKSRELQNMGVPKGKTMHVALRAVASAGKQGAERMNKIRLRERVQQVVTDPAAFVADEYFGELASQLIDTHEAQARFVGREEPAPWRQWGDDLDPNSVKQMENACKLPVTVAGALMPDAHLGYGLPIGGVLATDNAVIPYAVGVDIACRMKMTVLDLPVSALDDQSQHLTQAIEKETRFGIGSAFKKKRQHNVLDADWNVSPVTKQYKDKAWSQLGTSGSGNHFVEFGVLTLNTPDLALEAGEFLALLSHSGSRGTGANVCSYYSKLAVEMHPELPHELQQLAWLDLDTPEGLEYWNAMELMGLYAAANHTLIHQHIAAHLGAQVLADVENHHNFAWKETNGGREFIVHRKGATPAGNDTLGIIPGSMGAPGYVVRGRGNADSLLSAAHGAGRCMSRNEAKRRFNWSDVKQFLDQRKIRLISAGLDEVPMAYKNIEKVMQAQNDLVQQVARFDPRLVKMAPPGERPED